MGIFVCVIQRLLWEVTTYGRFFLALLLMGDTQSDVNRPQDHIIPEWKLLYAEAA